MPPPRPPPTEDFCTYVEPHEFARPSMARGHRPRRAAESLRPLSNANVELRCFGGTPARARAERRTSPSPAARSPAGELSCTIALQPPPRHAAAAFDREVVRKNSSTPSNNRPHAAAAIDSSGGSGNSEKEQPDVGGEFPSSAILEDL